MSDASPPKATQGGASLTGAPAFAGTQLNPALWTPAPVAPQPVRPAATAAPARAVTGARWSVVDMLLGSFEAEEGQGWHDALARLEEQESPQGSTWCVHIALRGSPNLILMATVVCPGGTLPSGDVRASGCSLPCRGPPSPGPPEAARGTEAAQVQGSLAGLRQTWNLDGRTRKARPRTKTATTSVRPRGDSEQGDASMSDTRKPTTGTLQ